MSEPESVEESTLTTLRSVSTATITMVLLKRGVRKSWLDGPKPLSPIDKRIVGPAFTIRFVPGRDDLSQPASYSKNQSFRDAIEAAPGGSVVVIDGRCSKTTATLGDILAARLAVKNVCAVVTDTPVRDGDEIRRLDLPVLCAGSAAPPSITGLTFAGHSEIIGCGGIAIQPHDIMVCDNDGAVVIPRELAKEVAEAGFEQERYERFVQQRVKAGASVVGLYPPNNDALRAYQEWIASDSTNDN